MRRIPRVPDVGAVAWVLKRIDFGQFGIQRESLENTG
jgi:hypothetical protein